MYHFFRYHQFIPFLKICLWTVFERKRLKVAMFTSKLYVRNPHVCFLNWIIPLSRAIFFRHTTKMARELKTDKGRIQLKKKRSRENMKYRDLKEIYASHISKLGFERVFPLQQSCDWTILRDAIRITIFRTRRGLFDFDELKRNVNEYKNWQTPDKLTYVSLKNVSCV